MPKPIILSRKDGYGSLMLLNILQAQVVAPFVFRDHTFPPKVEQPDRKIIATHILRHSSAIGIEPFHTAQILNIKAPSLDAQF